MTRLPFIHCSVASAWAAACALLSCGVGLAETPAEQVANQAPSVSVCLFALGDAPVRKAVRLQGKALEAAKLKERKSWEELNPGEAYQEGDEPASDYEPINPLEVPPSPIMVDVDKAKKTRKFLNLDHMGKTSVVIKRAPQLTLQRVLDSEANSATSGPPKFSKLTDIPIPPSADELLVFIIKPADTYEWTQAVFQSIDISPKKHGQNTLLIANMSSFPVRAEIQPQSPAENAQPFTATLAPGAVEAKITEDPAGERIALFAGDSTESFAARITTPREKNRQIIVIYNKMDGSRENLKSVPGMQSFSLPIKELPVEPTR